MRFKAKFHKNPKAFKDNFSTQTAIYASHRPQYPDVLFRYLAGECRDRNLAYLGPLTQKRESTDVSSTVNVKFPAQA